MTARISKEEAKRVLEQRQEERREAAKIVLGRRKLLNFTKYTFPQYEVADFHREYADILDKFIEGDKNRLIISVPAQHGKSELSSRRMPAYILGKYPDTRIAVCGYSDTFASKFNRQIQRIIQSKEYQNVFPDTRLADKPKEGTRNSHEFDIVGYTGSLMSVGVGGGLTGNPVDVAIIDDPYKDHEQAFSPVYRDKVWEWYESVLDKRLHNDSKVIIVMTRWHDDDLVGRLLKLEKEGKTSQGWEVINFPAIKDNEKTYYDQREPGEVLWPERHSKERLEERRRKDPIRFEAMDQGRPPKEGKKMFFDEFDYNKHVIDGDIPIDKSRLLGVSLDFNLNPVSMLLGQIVYGKGIFIQRELQANGGTDALLNDKCQWLRDGDYFLQITGDNSGHSGSSNSSTTDYEQIETFFGQKVDDVTRKANRLHIHSRKICNYVFRNVPIFISGSGCPNLIREILNAKANKSGGLLKDDKKNRNDLVDALRYLINLWFRSIKDVDDFISMLSSKAELPLNPEEPKKKPSRKVKLRNLNQKQ